MINIYDRDEYSFKLKPTIGIKNRLVNLVLTLRNTIKGNPNRNSPGLIQISRKNEKTIKPTIIIISGGGYFSRDKTIEAIPSSYFFKELGFNVFILNYRVAPYKYPIAIEDAKRAIRFLRYNALEFNINKSKIGIIGYSAGGHITTMISSDLEINNVRIDDEIEKENCIPNFQILCYPLINLLDNSKSIRIVRNVILDKKTKSYNESDLNSSLNVNHQTPITFIWHSKKDKVISYQQSSLYSDSLKKNNVDYEFHLFEEGGHAIGLANQESLSNQDVYNWTKLCSEWLKKNKII